MDAVKFIAAVCVVAIHATAYKSGTDADTMFGYRLYRMAFEFAVPFFFAAAGFFLAVKSVRAATRYAARIATIFALSCLLYLVFELGRVVLDRLVLGVPFWEGIDKQLSRLTIAGVVRGNAFQVHLWYLAALALAALVVAYLFKRRWSPARVLIAALVVYAAWLSNLLPLSPIVAFGGLPRAFFYVALGIFIRSRGFTGRWPLLKALALLALYSVTRSMGMGNLVEVLMAVSVFYLLQWSITGTQRKTVLSRLGSRSLSVYILHMMILSGTLMAFSYLGIPQGQIQGMRGWPLIAIGIATLLSIALDRPFVQIYLARGSDLLTKVFAELKGQDRQTAQTAVPASATVSGASRGL